MQMASGSPSYSGHLGIGNGIGSMVGADGSMLPVAGPPTPPPGIPAPPAGSFNPAQFYRTQGQPTYAAQLWESHHPYAVQHGNVPGWVTQALLHALQGMQHSAQAAAAPAAPPQAQIQ